ncbi:hypothetical protein BST94_12360 [Nonlabens xylanidelens]|nr:hypothetical protein BST94_12360 [Nonlabens xylanidelens]
MNKFFKTSALLWLPFLFLLLYLSSQIAKILEFILIAFFLFSWVLGVFGVILVFSNWQRYKSILFFSVFFILMPFVVILYFVSQLH